MFDYVSRIAELSLQRFCCSQIEITLALELKDCTNPEIKRELVKAMNGLCGGIGGSGKDCGSLTGAACAIGLLCGRGEPGEIAHEKLREMVSELVTWFENEYGSIECMTILGGKPAGQVEKRKVICPGIIQATFENAVRIMLEYGIEIY